MRKSNLELYRIVCMLMIVAHHYVLNSGLLSEDGPLIVDKISDNSLFLILFGAWGKTGINCFLMITGYFMCTSKITFRKFLKLMGQIYLYRWILFAVFYIAGYEVLSVVRIVKLAMPVWDFSDNFTSCFIGFWLTIPFLNILIQNISKRQHEMLLVLMLVMYTLLGSIPMFDVTFNYVTWFGIIYIIASYIRLYPNPVFENRRLWGALTIGSLFIAAASIIAMQMLFGKGVYFFVSDSNRLMAVVVAVCSFLWFKNIDIRNSKLINSVGAATFGVFLIHTNSDAMRTWLWKDTVNVVGHYSSMSICELAMYSICVVLVIFVVCNIVDQLRIVTLEKYFFHWYDKEMAAKVDMWLNKVI